MTEAKEKRREARLSYMLRQMDPDLYSDPLLPVNKRAAARRWRKRKRRRKMQKESRRRNR